METHFLLDLLGYTGSALIVIAIMMSSLVWLRLINLAGAAVFAVYGGLIHAYPVAMLNGFVVLVNLFYLTRLLRTRRFFQLLNLKPDSEYLRYFLEFYRREIAGILPDYEYRPVPNQLTLFIVRDCAPVGVFIAEQKDSVLRVWLDFVVPGYRDVKLGRFLFVEQAELFRRRGIREIVIAPRTQKFRAYLIKVGFEPVGPAPEALRIRLATAAD